MKCVCWLLSVICLVSLVSAQTSWWRTYGGTDREEALSAQQTTDGGYIVVGWTESFGIMTYGVYLIKTNAHGDTAWTRVHGGTDFYQGISGQQTADGGYVVTGYVARANDRGGDQYVYLLKTNAWGDTMWTGTYEWISYECGQSVQQTSDHGYIIAGYTADNNDDVYVVKTDSSGDALWHTTYGGSSAEEGLSVRQTTDGGYIIVGETKSFGAGDNDVYVVKTNPSGDTLWTRAYGGPAGDGGASVQQTSEGGYIIVGSTGSFGSGGSDAYVIKTTASGDTAWTRTYGGTANDGAGAVQQTTDGGYIVVGTTNSFGAGKADVYLIKTNAQGDTLWTRTFGGPEVDGGSSAQQTDDGGYIIGGHTTSYGAGAVDVYLIKTDANGRVGVTEEHPKVQAMSRLLAATVIRSLPQRAVALDVMGCRAANPRSGIFFIQERSAVGGERSAVAIRKVVLQR